MQLKLYAQISNQEIQSHNIILPSFPLVSKLDERVDYNAANAILHFLFVSPHVAHTHVTNSVQALICL